MTHNAPPVPRGCGWALLVSGGLLATVGGLSLAAIPIVWQRSQEVWMETQGTITSISIEKGERKSDRHRSSSRRRTKSYSSAPTYQVVLAYDYEALGKRRTGLALAPEQPINDEERADALAIAGNYAPGQGLTIFYHPNDGDRSRLSKYEDRREFLWDLIFGVLFSLGGCSALFFGRWVLKNRSDE